MQYQGSLKIPNEKFTDFTILNTEENIVAPRNPDT